MPASITARVMSWISCRQGAAVGVAQHHPARAGMVGREHRVERVGRVGLVAVEEVLGVEQRLAALGDHVGDQARMFSRFSSRVIPSAVVTWKSWVLPTRQTPGVSRVHHLRQHVVVGRRPPGPLGHAEGGEGGAGLGPRLEEIAVGRVRAGPAALDVVDPEPCRAPRRWRSSRRTENCTPWVCCPSRRVVS